MKKIAIAALIAIAPTISVAGTHSPVRTAPATNPNAGTKACIVWGLSNADYHGATFICDYYDGPTEGTPNWDRWNHRR